MEDARGEKPGSGEKTAPPLPVLPSPTEVKAILLIIAYIKIFTSAEAPPGVLQLGLVVPCVPNLSGQASFRNIMFFQAQY